MSQPLPCQTAMQHSQNIPGSYTEASMPCAGQPWQRQVNQTQGWEISSWSLQATATPQSSSNHHLAEPEQTTLRCSREQNRSLSQHDTRLQHPVACLSPILGEVFLTGILSLFWWYGIRLNCTFSPVVSSTPESRSQGCSGAEGSWFYHPPDSHRAHLSQFKSVPHLALGHARHGSHTPLHSLPLPDAVRMFSQGQQAALHWFQSFVGAFSGCHCPWSSHIMIFFSLI